MLVEKQIKKFSVSSVLVEKQIKKRWKKHKTLASPELAIQGDRSEGHAKTNRTKKTGLVDSCWNELPIMID